jgi:hypothetical protein
MPTIDFQYHRGLGWHLHINRRTGDILSRGICGVWYVPGCDCGAFWNAHTFFHPLKG